MNWLDIVLGLILLASVLSSFRKGLSREVIGLVTACAALLLAIWFYGSAAVYLSSYLSSRMAANFAGFAMVFCGVMLAGGLVSVIVGRFLRISGLSFLDHLLGIGFGLLRGILVGVAVITAVMAFAPSGRSPEEVVHSRLAPYLVGASSVAAAMAPHELKEGFRASYEHVHAAWLHGVTPRAGRREGEE